LAGTNAHENITVMRMHFYIGLLIIIVAEILLIAKMTWVQIFFTPLAWTGYILLIDGVVFKIKQESRIINRRKTFIFMVGLSALFWYGFEFFNLFIKNWRYEGLPPEIWIQVIGFTWAFATIGPGMFETADVLRAIDIFRIKTKKFQTPKGILYAVSILGALCLFSLLILPYEITRYLVICLWLGPILLFDPLNYVRGRTSILKEWESGDIQNFLCLLAAGIICGFLWEFWNYWATTKWVYRVPYFAEPKLFEMPLFGYLGFPLLALDYYVLYNLVLKRLD
jgi:hypothetical protein